MELLPLSLLATDEKNGSMPFPLELDRSGADMAAATLVPGDRWGQRIAGQMFQPGHAEVGDGGEVAHVAESACGALGLLQQAVHSFGVGVAGAVVHAANGAFQMRLQGSDPEGMGSRCLDSQNGINRRSPMRFEAKRSNIAWEAAVYRRN